MRLLVIMGDGGRTFPFKVRRVWYFFYKIAITCGPRFVFGAENKHILTIQLLRFQFRLKMKSGFFVFLFLFFSFFMCLQLFAESESKSSRGGPFLQARRVRYYIWVLGIILFIYNIWVLGILLQNCDFNTGGSRFWRRKLQNIDHSIAWFSVSAENEFLFFNLFLFLVSYVAYNFRRK